MLIVAVAISVIASVAGIYLSFFIDSAPAPTIVLLMTATFLVAFVKVTLTARRTDRAMESA